MRLKPFLPLVLLVFSTIYANAQELYQYTKNSVIQTSSGPISIIRAGGAYIHYAKAEPAYERFEPSTSTDPTITRNDDGLWEIDYSKFTKPAQSVVCSMIRASWTQYMSMLKASCKDNDQVWITVRTDSKGKFIMGILELSKNEPEFFGLCLEFYDDIQKSNKKTKISS